MGVPITKVAQNAAVNEPQRVGWGRMVKRVLVEDGHKIVVRLVIAVGGRAIWW